MFINIYWLLIDVNFRVGVTSCITIWWILFTFSIYTSKFYTWVIYALPHICFALRGWKHTFDLHHVTLVKILNSRWWQLSFINCVIIIFIWSNIMQIILIFTSAFVCFSLLFVHHHFFVILFIFIDFFLNFTIS